jgi:TRAP-type C4-dicarboxylate transport system permease small subunit
MKTNPVRYAMNIAIAILAIIAGAALVGTLILTGCDIIGRTFGHPVPGTYEVVSFASVLVLGLAIPLTSRLKGHVYMDVVIDKVPPLAKRILKVITRLMGAALFLLMGYSIFKVGNSFRTGGEVTPVLSLPFYPIAYALGVAFFVECLFLAVDAIESGGKTNE